MEYLKEKLITEQKLIDEWKILEYTPVRVVVDSLIDWTYTPWKGNLDSIYVILDNTPNKVIKALNINN